MRRLVIVGAGPMGVEAALLGIARGFAVTVIEGERIGAALVRWGDTRAFSPLAMNLSSRVRARLAASPADDALCTGPELATLLVETCRDLDVRQGARVVSIARARMSRGDLAGHPVRAERPFRILIEHEGREQTLAAECVIDASGLAGGPQPLGAGGWARGECALRGDPRLVRDLATLLSTKWDGRRVALVGHGHSSAHAVGWLVDRAAAVTWLVRSANRRPVLEVADDPLPSRAHVVSRANAVAEKPPANLRIERRANVEAIADHGALTIEWSNGSPIEVDAIVGLTGDCPDHELTRELALSISPASDGALGLWRAVSSVTDCLTVPAVSPEALDSGEPGFHVVGRKSYGRARTFLLQTGLQQLETIVARL